MVQAKVCEGSPGGRSDTTGGGGGVGFVKQVGFKPGGKERGTNYSGYILRLLLIHSLFAVATLVIIVICCRPFVLVNGGSSSSAYMNMNGLDELVMLLLLQNHTKYSAS